VTVKRRDRRTMDWQ